MVRLSWAAPYIAMARKTYLPAHAHKSGFGGSLPPRSKQLVPERSPHSMDREDIKALLESYTGAEMPPFTMPPVMVSSIAMAL